MRRSFRFGMGVASCGVTVLVTVSAVSATPTEVPDGISSAAIEDVQAEISRGEIDSNGLADEVQFQEHAAPIITEIAYAHPDTFAVSEFPGDGTAQLHFTGDVPADVISELANESGINAVGNAAYDSFTGDAVAAAVHSWVYEEVVDGVQVSTRVDHVSGEVNVAVTDEVAAFDIRELLESGELALSDEDLASGTLDNTAPDVDEEAVADFITVEIEPSLDFTMHAINGALPGSW